MAFNCQKSCYKVRIFTDKKLTSLKGLVLKGLKSNKIDEFAVKTILNQCSFNSVFYVLPKIFETFFLSFMKLFFFFENC